MPRTPSPDNLMQGAGELFFNRFTTLGASTGFRHLGNCTSVAINHTFTELEKKTSMDGTRGTYKKKAIDLAAEITIVMDEFTSKNYALSALGIEEALLQAAGTTTDEPINGGLPLNFGVWYPLTKATTHPDRVRGVTITLVEQGAVPLTLGDDYERNLETGMIRLITGGAADPTVGVTWTGTIPELTAASGRRRVRALSQTEIIGRLLYIPAGNQDGPRYEIDAYRVQIQPGGEMQFIHETEWGNFTIVGKTLIDMTREEGDRFYSATRLDTDDVEQEDLPEEESS